MMELVVLPQIEHDSENLACMLYRHRKIRELLPMERDRLATVVEPADHGPVWRALAYLCESRQGVLEIRRRSDRYVEHDGLVLFFQRFEQIVFPCIVPELKKSRTACVDDEWA